MTKAQLWLPFASEIIGIRVGDKKPLCSGWSTWQGTPNHLRAWERGGHGFGMLGRKHPAIDIDVTLPGLADACLEEAGAAFGYAPVRRRGTSKALLMYRTDETLRKRRIEFTDPAGNRQAIELLATGQQYVVEGIHPDGQPYAWSEQPNPWLLNTITAEQWDRYCEAVGARLTRIGCTVTKDGKGGALRTDAARRASEALLAREPSVDPIAAMMYWRERHQDKEMHHPEFVELCAAFHGAAGEHADELFDQFRECLPSPRDTEPNTEKTFFSFDSGVNLGWSRLCQITGFVPPEEFEEPVDAAAMDVPDPTMAARAMMQERFVYVADVERWHDLRDNVMLKHSQFEATDEARDNIAPYGRRGERSAHAIMLNDRATRKLASYTYLPGQPPIVEDRANKWRPSTLKPITGDVTPWLKHVETLFPNDAERNRIFDWIAHTVQRPARKINYSPVLLSTVEGNGKDTLFYPLMQILGEDNCATINPADIVAPFNSRWIEKQFLVVNEVRTFERKAFMDALKPLITNPPGTLDVRKKNVAEYTIPNIVNVVMMTNRLDALAPTFDDRRIWIHDCSATPAMTEQAAAELWGWYAQLGCSYVYAWLLARDIAGFNPKAHAPMTQAKEVMIEDTRNPVEDWIAQLFEEGGEFHGRTVLNAHDLDKINRPHWVARTKLRAGIRDHGFKPAGVQKDPETKKAARVYAKRPDIGSEQIWIALAKERKSAS